MDRKVFQKSAQTVPHRGVLRPADFSQDFTFQHYPAPDRLARYVAHIWVISWDLPAGVQRQSPAVLPDPQINLFFSAEGAGVQGVFKATKVYAASGKGRVAGITFRPGGLYAYWPHSAAELTDTNTAITAIFPQVDAAYITALLACDSDTIASRLQQLLESRPPRPDGNIALVQSILARLEQDTTLRTVEAVAAACGKSERALQQLFQTYAGVGVKWVLLRNRLLAAAEIARASATPDWAAIALDLGYNSQAHFITDFTRTIGVPPVQYMRTLA